MYSQTDDQNNQPLSWSNLTNDDIFSQMGFKNLSDEEKDKLAKTMNQTIMRRAIARIATLLTKPEQDEFMGLIDKEDNDAITQFLNSRGINIDKIMAEEALIYKAEMVESSKVIVNKAQADLENMKNKGE